MYVFEGEEFENLCNVVTVEFSSVPAAVKRIHFVSVSLCEFPSQFDWTELNPDTVKLSLSFFPFILPCFFQVTVVVCFETESHQSVSQSWNLNLHRIRVPQSSPRSQFLLKRLSGVITMQPVPFEEVEWSDHHAASFFWRGWVVWSSRSQFLLNRLSGLICLDHLARHRLPQGLKVSRLFIETTLHWITFFTHTCMFTVVLSLYDWVYDVWKQLLGELPFWPTVAWLAGKPTLDQQVNLVCISMHD